MFERFKTGRPTNGDTATTGGRTAVADAERPRASDARATETEPAERAARLRHPRAPATLAARARQREEFGGINWGAAFFGWLVAVGLGSLLVGILAAAGAAVGLTEGRRPTASSQSDARRSAWAAASRCSSC